MIGYLRYGEKCLFSASNATPKKQWLWVGKILHQGLMRSWLSVDDCLTNTGNKTGRQITPKATFTFFSSNVFLREFFYWFIVTIKFKRPNQTLSEKESFEERNIWHNFHSDNISSISTAREKEIKVMQWVLLSFEPNVMTFNSCRTAVVTNQSTINTWYLTFHQLKKLHISISTN